MSAVIEPPGSSVIVPAEFNVTTAPGAVSGTAKATGLPTPPVEPVESSSSPLFVVIAAPIVSDPPLAISEPGGVIEPTGPLNCTAPPVLTVIASKPLDPSTVPPKAIAPPAVSLSVALLSERHRRVALAAAGSRGRCRRGSPGLSRQVVSFDSGCVRLPISAWNVTGVVPLAVRLSPPSKAASTVEKKTKAGPAAVTVLSA